MMIRTIANFVMAGGLLFGSGVCAFGESLFWTIQGDSHIYRWQLDGSDPTPFLTSQAGQIPTGLAIDQANGYLYWASTSLSSGGHIVKIKFGEQPSPQNVADTPYGGIGDLALDVKGGYAYWTVPDAGVIQRVALTGGTASTILTDLGDPMGLAIDYLNRKLVWSESSTGEIGRSDLNGANATTIFSGLVNPTGVAFDYIGHSLYWAEADMICHDGPTGDSVLDDLGNVFGLDINQRDHTVYWSCPSGDSQGIHRANLNGSSPSLLLDVPAGYIAVAVPEPSGILLAGIGLWGLSAHAWRWRMKNG